MTKVTIDRELLEQAISTSIHEVPERIKARSEIRAILAAPRQPEGDDLDQRMKAAGMFSVAELLAGAPLDAFMKHAGVNDLATFAQWLEMRRAECIRMHARYDLGERNKGDDLYEWTIAHAAVFNEVHVNFKAAHADAQRAIAELREECKIQHNSLAGARNQLRANRLETERLAVDWLAAVAERDTLRQQLAEQDAEIERLRVKLMTIASAEPGRHNIEWAKAMAATGSNEAYAKWREAFGQRDKLAGLLRMVRQDGWYHPLEEHEIAQIDAALAEVKP